MPLFLCHFIKHLPALLDLKESYNNILYLFQQVYSVLGNRLNCADLLLKAGAYVRAFTLMFMLVCINVFDLSQVQLYHSNLATNHSLEPLCFAYNTAWSLVFATHCSS